MHKVTEQIDSSPENPRFPSCFLSSVTMPFIVHDFFSDVPSPTLAFLSKDVFYSRPEDTATVLVIAFALVEQLLNSHLF